MKISAPSCRDLLLEEWLKRQKVNPRYSMRSFARTLGLSPSYVSMVLSGKRRIDPARVAEIGTRLKWDRAHKALFEAVTLFEGAPPEAKADALLKVEELASSGNVSVIKIDIFKAISTWHHAAICALVGVEGFQSDPTWIAKRLGILKIEAELAVGRLVRVGMLKYEDGALVKAAPFFSVGDVPSAAIRGYHKQMLEMGALALEDQPMDARDISGITMAIDKAAIPEVREKIIEFTRGLRQGMQRRTKDAVYQLSVAFFRLDRE